MTHHQCHKCGAIFPKNQNLQRHLARKKPCDPILDAPMFVGAQQVNPNQCRFCNRNYSRPDSLARHLKMCKIATTDAGMDRLFEHTLQRQVAEMRIENAEMRAQMAELTTLMKSQLTLATQQIAQPIQHAGQVNNAPVTTNNAPVTTNNTVINIHPWDGDRRVGVEIAHIVAAFADNAKLREYSRLGDHELTDPDIAPPYVTELLMDLTKRAHEDVSARNVYLNPRRADQALVHTKSGRWEVLPLAEATRMIFDGVAKTIHRVVMTDAERRQLPLEAQNALSMAGMLYEDTPDEYAARAKTPMAAHLVNTAPCHSTAIWPC